MHAVVTALTFDDRAAAEAELSAIVSRVAGMSRFVAGYWVSLGPTEGTSIIVFESRKHAEALADFAGGAPYASVAPREIRVGEVMGYASDHSRSDHGKADQ